MSTYSYPVAAVELTEDTYYICKVEVNGVTEMARQTGGWTVPKSDHELLYNLLHGRLVAKASALDMPEVDACEIAGYFTVEGTLPQAIAEVQRLREMYERANQRSDRHGLGRLTEPQWPDFEKVAAHSPSSEKSRPGQGRDAFVLGVRIKNIAHAWANLESIRLTAAFPKRVQDDDGKWRQVTPKESVFYLRDHAGPAPRPLPMEVQ